MRLATSTTGTLTELTTDLVEANNNTAKLAGGLQVGRSTPPPLLARVKEVGRQQRGVCLENTLSNVLYNIYIYIYIYI